MATAETSGDDFDWTREAYLNSDLVAAVLISFRGRSPGADDDERPSTSALPAAMGSLEWGKRIKRSRLMRIPRILPLTREEEEEREITEATAAVEAKVDKSKGKRLRASPKSPLEGYSSASASGGEEGTKAGRSTGGSIAAPEERRDEVAATNQRAPMVSRLVRQPSSKKMTKVELQAMQMSLLEEKAKLLEEIGTWRKTLEEMRVDNSKLKEDTLQRSCNSWELFRNTHLRKDGTFVDTRSKNIDDDMSVRIAESSQPTIEGGELQTPSHNDINEMYDDVISGPKKNSLYRFGSKEKVIFDRQLCTPRLKCRPSSSSAKFQALKEENESLRGRITTLEQTMQEILSHFELSHLSASHVFPTSHGFDSQETQDPRAPNK